MANVVKGDLIEQALAGKYDVIVHGCNCKHIMGAGIAKQIKEKIPSAYEADLRTALGDPRKLGNFSMAEVLVGTEGSPSVVINAYTQFEPSPPVDYLAVASVFEKLNYLFTNCHIGMPRLGSGLAGGNVVLLESIVFNQTPNVKELTIVDYLPTIKPITSEE